MTNPLGPAITPKTTPGGGDARPPYLQMRRPVGPNVGPTYPGQQTQPVVTPKPSVVPGEVSPFQNLWSKLTKPKQQTLGPGGQAWGPGGPQSMPKAPKVTPRGQAPAAPTQQPESLADLYKFFQSDLENQKNQALAGSRSDAAARGVFYGTPLTGSEADINTQYLRGLGQLQAGMYGNEQQNEISRLQLATQLYGYGAQGQPAAPGPIDFSGLASLFGQSPAVAGTRTGPAVTPLQKSGDKITTKKTETN